MRESAEIIAALLVWLLLLALGNLVPLLLALQVHPLVGCLAAVGAALLWVRLVPPTFGCLQGVVSVNGLFLILATAMMCLLLQFRRPKPQASDERPRGVPVAASLIRASLLSGRAELRSSREVFP